MLQTQLLFNPAHLVERAKNVEGFNAIYEEVTDKLTLYTLAQEVAEEWTSDWSEGEGFGSSDYTYAIKSYIDQLLCIVGLNESHKTDFTPRLSVITIKS